MARKRMIDPKFWSDDKMMALTPMHRLLFIGIWNFSDDSGIHKNNDTMLKAEIFPCDPITIDEVGKLKHDLIDQELIIPFENQDIKLLRVNNWSIYQKINRPIPSKYELTEDSLSTHGVLTANRIEQNRVEGNGRQVTPNSPPFIEQLKNKYPEIDIDNSFRKFQLYNESKGRVYDDEQVAFEVWVERDIK